MSRFIQQARQHDLLQQGVSCAIATLFAIHGSDLLRDLPADPEVEARFNHALWLLGMLEDHLNRIQEQVDALDEAPTNKAEG